MWITFKRTDGTFVMVHESDLKMLSTHPNLDRFCVSLRSDAPYFEATQFECFHTIIEAGIGLTRYTELELPLTVAQPPQPTDAS